MCKQNRIVGWINIFFGVLGCISCFISSNCMLIEKITCINFTNEQYSIIGRSSMLLIIPILTTFIINLVYIFKNWHHKKSMILNVLAIISIILSIILFFILESYKYLYIFSVLVILGIQLLIFNQERDIKKHKILLCVMIINVILFIISIIGFICVKNDFKITYVDKEKNLIENIFKESNYSENDRLIRVKKNGKWGYIDYRGNTIIGYQYDDCTEFIEIENFNTNEKRYIAAVSIGNELRIITVNNKTIVCYKNAKQKGIIDCSYILYDIERNLGDDAKKLNTTIVINKEYSEYSYRPEIKGNVSYNYNLEDDIWLFHIYNNEGKRMELTFNTKTGSITYNKIKVNGTGEGTLLFMVDNNAASICTYTNGYIPIYNFEKEIFGWIDLNGEIHYINGKKQILDFTDRYIAIKDYSIDKVYLTNYDSQIISEYYEEIGVFNNGFVVKKQNGKNIYLDENLRQITQEYDFIDTSREKEGVLIVANINTDYSLYNLRYDLISVNTGLVIGRSFEDVGNVFKINSTSITEDNYNELKEELCSVNCYYLNTGAYEQHYK